MQAAPDLGIPEVKPAIESIRGEWFQKVSPRRRHSLVQARMTILLSAWGGENAFVGPEWRFYLLPPGERPSSLVPDVAFVRVERLPPELGELAEQPTIAPDIAVEILSPGDRLRVLEAKIRLYLDNGSNLVIVVDPDRRTVRMIERNRDATFSASETAIAAAYPTLDIDVDAIFRNLP